MNKIIEKAVKIAGGDKKLAAKIGVSQSFVNRMKHGKKQVPAELCIKIELAANREVTRYQLCPEAFCEGKQFGSLPDCPGKYLLTCEENEFTPTHVEVMQWPKHLGGGLYVFDIFDGPTSLAAYQADRKLCLWRKI